MKQVNLLPLARPSNSNFPICQQFLQVAFRLLQARDVRSNPIEFLLCQLEDSVTWSPTGVTSLQNLSEFRQREADAKCPLNYLDSFDGTLLVDSIPRGTSLRFG
jgi:hypothetical protein